MKKNLANYHRAISAIFSVPTFREIFKSGHSDYVLEKLGLYRAPLGMRKEAPIKKILSKAYSHLTLNYRNEYIYKNHIANKLLLDLHDLNQANMLNELRVAGSIADTVIINGTNTIYEIKTELDSPDKLKKQIEDYKKVSPKIFLVTHHSLVNKYLDLIGTDSTGLISLSEQHNFTIVKQPTLNYDHLNNKIMMGTLRKDEYTNIIQELFGQVPQVSNICFYRECQRLIDQIDSSTFHDLMLCQLRKRLLIEKDLIISTHTPFELKHICLSFNPDKKEYQNLYNFLNLTV
jgi:hypothetical protein